MAPPDSALSPAAEYVVVARRYRPQTFAELVGQEHIAQALGGAIVSNRVGHAYLFTGARGVGKTSAARILAKALNCQKGPTPEPCDQCDSCQSITRGGDLDVLEIDGASNRGIDEMRELRQGVNIRPSRSRFKIYIIDEVHMLTEPAFNALLKTLEEPPEHVKFIFCTTEPEKIPITVLSRCQRFDFAGIRSSSIAARLGQIAQAEGVEAEPAALEVLARRAAGSMRDSQSLLEQLLAFGGQRITVAEVERMLGTASDEALARLTVALLERQPAVALVELDTILTQGVDVGPLLDQLLGFYRDCLVAAVGCTADLFLYTRPSERELVAQAGPRQGVETLLASMYILEQTIARLRSSMHGRVLAELALVRICKLEYLDELPKLVAALRDRPGEFAATATPVRPGLILTTQSNPAPPAGSTPVTAHQPEAQARESSEWMKAEGGRRNDATPGDDDAHQSAHQPEALARETPGTEPQTVPAVAVPSAAIASALDTAAPKKKDLAAEPASESEAVEDLDATSIWRAVVGQLEGILAGYADQVNRTAISGPNRLVLTFPHQYTSGKAFCERPEHLSRLRTTLDRVAGRHMEIAFQVADREPESSSAAKSNRAAAPARLAERSREPWVRRAIELFDARPIRLDESDS